MRIRSGWRASGSSWRLEFPQVDILVNNAGLGDFGAFPDAEWSAIDKMIELDVTALSHLTYLFLPGMRERRWGRILQ